MKTDEIWWKIGFLKKNINIQKHIFIINLLKKNSLFQRLATQKNKKIAPKQFQISGFLFPRVATQKKIKKKPKATSNLQTPFSNGCLFFKKIKNNPKAISNLQSPSSKGCHQKKYKIIPKQSQISGFLFPRVATKKK